MRLPEALADGHGAIIAQGQCRRTSGGCFFGIIAILDRQRTPSCSELEGIWPPILRLPATATDT
ncbi:hypothetical protein ABTE06_23130, partial [Acinetobacter baumannii]